MLLSAAVDGRPGATRKISQIMHPGSQAPYAFAHTVPAYTLATSRRAVLAIVGPSLGEFKLDVSRKADRLPLSSGNTRHRVKKHGPTDRRQLRLFRQ